MAKVIDRAIVLDSRPTGTYYNNPMLNTMQYDVEFSDGVARECSANMIAEDMISKGRRGWLLSCIDR